MDPVAIRIGSVALVRWYGLLIVVGAVAAAYIDSREAKRRGQDPDHIWSVFMWCLIGGIIGARLQFVITASLENPAYLQGYLANPLSIINTREGGVGIFGALGGGLLAFYLYTRRQRLPFWSWTDIAIVGLPFAQAVGRWGNYFNQELYGGPTNLPWGIAIDCAHRISPYLCPPLGEFTEAARFHPTFLYESLWNLGVGLVLLWLARRFSRQWPPGSIFNLYVVAYPLGRFLVEFIRLGTPLALGLTLGQFFSLAAGLAGLAVFTYRLRRAASPPPTGEPVA
ncbi:prolipoprotein diacylglyceryl transferase [Candidatus Amarolinea dominans]|uniref:prolipoprotein diacylglyceryl transferase n=1 Tax=Candidatus Amarolinea dominans TaxID=3140696 RepID=UPI00313680D9|nr:prolipoprotein diacylglyceryl transferase [Anaerolineae bacterium]